jgi:predicted XRE-type DNA-binding protein
MSEEILNSSANVFMDLGFSPEEAAVLQMRADLMAGLRKFIRAKKLAQAKASEILNVSQSRVSDLILKFLVQGSKTEPYEVIFEKIGLTVFASCTCPAAKYKITCKHRERIIDGEKTGIVSNNKRDVKKVYDMTIGMEVEYCSRNIAENRKRRGASR